ncbi:hypothetical protein MBM_01656 [Drepanopeziza brunnea f. sp. 'multigermtubi' MB_m1]|uniref:Reverse transcriptase n=1 Tax=Marssonina brunnea f. sp. multigermtubi (strain MB_m1) TaxID=1072389 RepID=K1Y3H3_MARBU|nr:uncharacterized protein MBM_01656 [Drepanopeziza brunnea f. sp. 'multigermtubi' MB_m1]EKD19704.1 hypothetical protein MBM_01656 [Drepanopeziza brunnea f. sp. 'multigermtubi' MB_m1]
MPRSTAFLITARKLHAFITTGHSIAVRVLALPGTLENVAEHIESYSTLWPPSKAPNPSLDFNIEWTEGRNFMKALDAWIKIAVLQDTDSDHAPSSSASDSQLDPEAAVFVTQQRVLPQPPVSPITPPATRAPATSPPAAPRASRRLTISGQFPDSSVIEPSLIPDQEMSAPPPAFTAAQQEVINKAILAAVAQALAMQAQQPQPAVQPATLAADLQPTPEYFLPVLDSSVPIVEHSKVKWPRSQFSDHRGNVEYDAWKMDMKLFLEEYSGNFITGTSQVKAYFKCTSSEAKSMILEHMSLDFADSCTCAADVLRLLDHRFFDHNRVQSARKAYYQLTMSGSMSYNDFRSKFTAHAITSKISRARWFEDMCEKISPALKTHLMIEKYKMQSSYERLDEYLAIVDRESRNIKSEEAAIARRYASYASSSSANVSFTSGARTSGTRGILKKETWRPTSLSPRATSPAPSPFGSRSTSPSSIICFGCKKPGHMQRECPDLKLDKKIAEMTIDSYYGVGHNLWKELRFDFRSLIGGPQFLVPIELARNGFFIKTTAHIDSGANIFGAIKTSLASQLSSRFGNKFVTLPHPIVPTGYNGALGDPITYVILLTLTIDRRRINFPFLVTNLGSTDVLIGRKFIAHYDIGQRFGAKPQLYWPSDMLVIPYFGPRIFLDLSHTATKLSHQADASRRDQFEVDRSQPSTKERTWLTFDEHDSRHTTSISLISASLMRATLRRFRENYRAAKQAGTPPPDEFVFLASVHDIQREQDRRDIDSADEETIQIASMNGVNPAQALSVKYAVNDAKVDLELPFEYAEFKDLFSKKASDVLAVRRPKVDHKIVLATENTLITKLLRRLTDEQLSEVKQYVQDHLHKGFIEPSNAPYSALILFIKKKDGSIRLCVDYRRLNSITQKDLYPLPLINEMIARISRATIFIKIDIQQAFHRIRISSESKELTTFRTRYSTYKYKVLPFGLTNRPATFQRFINDILMEHLDDFCSAYLDDILIYSTNELEHTEHIKKIMRILNDHGLQADIKKSCKEAWEKLKVALQNALILCHYDPYKQTRLETDSSDGVIAGVLSQLQEDGFYYPIGFFSKTMIDAELNYLIHDKELLAIFHDSITIVNSIPLFTHRTADTVPQVVLAPVEEAPPHLLIPGDILLDEDPSDHTNMIAYDIDGYDIIDRVLRANETSPLLQDLRDGIDTDIDYELRSGKLYFQGRLVVPLEPLELRTALIRHVYDQPCVAHAGIIKTRQLLELRYIANCKCARMKAKRDKTPGLLVPLPIPARTNQHLTMDFTELPLDEEGYDFGLVIVDRLSKRSITIPCHKNITAKGLADLFFVYWVRYFGMPDSIVSDRGPQFVSTFWLSNGYEARFSFDLINPDPPSSATERLNREEAIQVATRAQHAIEFAQSSIAVQQEKMKRLADLRRRPADWTVGDEVWIDTRNWKMDRPSRKLLDKWYGPVEVLAKVGESWKVQLPEGWKIHPVFHSHSLRKYTGNPLPGQVREPPAPIQLLPEQDEWEIEEILGSKVSYNTLYYQIKWTGADDDLNWYPCSDAMTGLHMLRRFHLAHPQAKGPPRALPLWLQAYNEGRDDYSELEDNRPMTATARTQFFEGGG